MNNEEHFNRSRGSSRRSSPRSSRRSSSRNFRRSSPRSSRRSSPRNSRRSSPRNSRRNRVPKTQTSTAHTLGGRGGAPYWGWGYGYPWVYFNCNPWEGDCYLYDGIPKILYSYNIFDQNEQNY